jgi:hypothetical protein
VFWFRAIHSDPSTGVISKQADDLVRQWKLQPERYTREFDFDQNSKIQQAEWKAVPAVARKQVLAKTNSEKSEHHLVLRPQETNQPYIISATLEEDLVARKKLKDYSAVTAGILVFSTLVIMISIRASLFI